LDGCDLVIATHALARMKSRWSLFSDRLKQSLVKAVEEKAVSMDAMALSNLLW
jgi:hypothetical protein